VSVRFHESASDSVAVVKIVLFVNSSRSISMKMDVNPPNPSEMEVETMNPCTAGQKRFRRLLNEFTYLCVVTALGKRADVVLQAVAQLCGEKSQIIPACGNGARTIVDDRKVSRPIVQVANSLVLAEPNGENPARAWDFVELEMVDRQSSSAPQTSSRNSLLYRYKVVRVGSRRRASPVGGGSSIEQSREDAVSRRPTRSDSAGRTVGSPGPRLISYRLCSDGIRGRKERRSREGLA
jgi:hypothetical protein